MWEIVAERPSACKHGLATTAIVSRGGTIPDELHSGMPLSISAGFAAQYLWSADNKTLVAYVYNVLNHLTEPVEINTEIHRVPKPVDLVLTVKNLSGDLSFCLFDLNAKTVCREGKVINHSTITVAHTKSDDLLFVCA